MQITIMILQNEEISNALYIQSEFLMYYAMSLSTARIR